MTRWFAERTPAERTEYAQGFTDRLALGEDLHGEARLVDVFAPRGARVLDAGCGTARVGAELARRGHAVTAFDADELLVVAAQPEPGLSVQVADLVTLDLRRTFEVAVLAGNVVVFLEPGTERAALTRLHAHLEPGGLLVTGFATDREYTVAAFDADAAAVGFTLRQRFATWDLQPWHDGADWAVSVLVA